MVKEVSTQVSRARRQWGARAVLACLCSVAFVCISGAIGSAASAERSGTALVNIQVSDGKDFAAVQAMMDELVKRGITATLWMSRTEYSPEQCSYLRMLSQAGYEIAVKSETDLRPLSYDEQLRLFGELAAAIRQCTGRSPGGFRATRFSWNEHTVEVARKLGFYYFMGNIDGDPRFGDVPYFSRDGFLGLLGVTTARYPDGSTGILCDSPASRNMSPQEFQDILFATIDQRLAIGKPMVFEWHPASTSRPEEGNPWWQVFINFLDYLQSKGSAVRFTTGRDLVLQYDTCDC